LEGSIVGMFLALSSTEVTLFCLDEKLKKWPTQKVNKEPTFSEIIKPILPKL
jgi:hypothetical protein